MKSFLKEIESKFREINERDYDGDGEQEVVLTEFVVVETYVIKARTIMEAQDMVDNDNFKYGVEDYTNDIKPFC